MDKSGRLCGDWHSHARSMRWTEPSQVMEMKQRWLRQTDPDVGEKRKRRLFGRFLEFGAVCVSRAG